MDPYREPVEEEVVETRRTVPVRRRYYGPAGDPFGGLISLLVLIFVVLLILDLFEWITFMDLL